MIYHNRQILDIKTGLSFRAGQTGNRIIQDAVKKQGVIRKNTGIAEQIAPKRVRVAFCTIHQSPGRITSGRDDFQCRNLKKRRSIPLGHSAVFVFGFRSVDSLKSAICAGAFYEIIPVEDAVFDIHLMHAVAVQLNAGDRSVVQI